jgi:hypothetical protein
MMFIQGSKKLWSLGSNAVIRWGMQLGGHNFGVTQAWRGAAEKGMKEASISLRRIYRKEFGQDQLQMVLEITQHYDKSGRTETVVGSIDLHGDALDDFVKRVTIPEPQLMVDTNTDPPRWSTTKVYDAMTEQAKRRTSLENVEDVLNALRGMHL